MPATRPHILIVAGHDPSGGAGLLADVKTCEKLGVYAFAVSTSLTVQDDEQCYAVDWSSNAQVESQMDVLLKKFKPMVLKVGIVKDASMLKAVIDLYLKYIPKGKIIIDPVLAPSAGEAFVQNDEIAKMRLQYERAFLITPNTVEACALASDNDALSASAQLSQKVSVFLKGGHAAHDTGRDHLFHEGKQYSFKPAHNVYPKHGSGCVLASAIASYLCKGFSLHTACVKGRTYVQRFLRSNSTLLGYHA